MDSEQLLESFEFRFKASGVREPTLTAEALLAHVFHRNTKEVHDGETPHPPSSGQMMQIIRQLEEFAEKIEAGESPQELLGCVDF